MESRCHYFMNSPGEVFLSRVLGRLTIANCYQQYNNNVVILESSVL